MSIATEIREEVSAENIQTANSSDFEGFGPAEFEVFEAPEFGQRMPLLKARITPKLKLLASAVNKRMGETLGEIVYPHVALHLRRSVNPPQETWAAFARNARAYKPYVHIRAAIGAEQFRVVVYVEDYADDKLLFADNLAGNASKLAKYLRKSPTIYTYDILDKHGMPCHGKTVTAEALREFAAKMHRVKGQHARFGIPIDRDTTVGMSGSELVDAILGAAALLRPLYDLGK